MPPGPIAALATQMSSRPQRSTAAVTIASPPAGSAASECSATASPPAAMISAATWSAGPRPSASVPRLRLLTTTFAPCRASARQNERPSPRPPPDTTATRPASGVSFMIPPARLARTGRVHRHRRRPALLRYCSVATAVGRKPGPTAEVMLPGGWLRTGDGGSFDADGYLYLHDRLTDMIVPGAPAPRRAGGRGRTHHLDSRPPGPLQVPGRRLVRRVPGPNRLRQAAEKAIRASLSSVAVQ